MSKRKKIDPELSKPIGPLVVEPCQWDHGASIVICHRERGVIAKIESINDGCDEYIDMDTAEREPYDLAYAHLFKASPDLLLVVEAINQRWEAGNFTRDPVLWDAMKAAIARTTPKPLGAL